MLHQQDSNKEGSFFCELCDREADRIGRCSCGGKVSFIGINDNRYIKLVMASKKKVSNKLNISYARVYERDHNSKEDIKWL